MGAAWRNKYNPGVTVAVVKDGAKMFADGFGKKDGTDAASSRPTEHTRDCIGHQGVHGSTSRQIDGRTKV